MFQANKVEIATGRIRQLDNEILAHRTRLHALDAQTGDRDDLAALIEARAAVYVAQSEVAAGASTLHLELVGMDDLAKQADEILDCKASDASIPFTVLPAGDTLSIKKEKAATLTAQGGTLTPRFQLVGVNTDKIKVDQVAQTSSVLVLTITAGKEAVAAAAAPTLVLTDGSGKKTVTVKVVVTD